MINKISKFFVIAFILGFIYLLFYGYKRKYDIENHGKVTIGKYVSYRRYPKTESNYFIYYVNGKKYKEDAGRASKGFPNNRGKFYKIIYSEKYNEVIRVRFDEEIKDTLKILEAGFYIEDIK